VILTVYNDDNDDADDVLASAAGEGRVITGSVVRICRLWFRSPTRRFVRQSRSAARQLNTSYETTASSVLATSRTVI